jgi:FKBP-type peptidyl-prolyl cis-trans isomerase
MLRITEAKKKNVPPTEQEKQKRKNKLKILQKANDLRNEDRDDVKEMNKMIMYAKVVTIRDKQLNQKKQIHHHYVEEEK